MIKHIAHADRGPADWFPPTSQECTAPMEAARLFRSDVWRGEGVPSGDDRPVLLVPGFLADDGSLAVLTKWLRRAGYRTRRAGIGINASCSEEACSSLEGLLEELVGLRAQRVSIVGHSRGGVFAKAVASARPDLVAGIVTLASPTVPQVPRSPLLLGHRAIAMALRGGHFPGLASWRCLTGTCGHRLRDALTGPVSGRRRLRIRVLADRRVR